MSLKNILAWLGGNLLLRLLPETVGVGHIFLSSSAICRSHCYVGHRSLWTWQMLCKTQQAATTSDTKAVSTSLRFKSLLHLPFSRPKAFSTAMRAELSR